MKDAIVALVSRYLPGPFKSSGPNVVCPCPFHKGGQESHPSFGINTETGDFNCFACHESGSLKRLLKLLGAPRDRIDTELSSITPELERVHALKQLKSRNFNYGKDPFKAEVILPEALIGVYDWMPVSLAQRGFDPSLMQDMEIGFDKNNSRITYPLRDVYGNLAGISGGATRKDQFPKYKVYQGGRQVGSMWQPGDFGKWFDEQYPGFHCENHRFLWNYDRVFPKVSMSGARDTVYVVEGFKACLWMIQSGFRNTVAAMGSYLSEYQQRLIHRLGGDVVLCFDNDEAGRRASQKVGSLLWRPLYGRVKVLRYPTQDNNTQPDDYPSETLIQMVNSAVPFHALFGGTLTSPRRNKHYDDQLSS